MDYAKLKLGLALVVWFCGGRTNAESVCCGNAQFTNSGTGPDLQRPNYLRNHLDAPVRYFVDWIGKPVRFDRSRHFSMVRLLLRKRSSAASLNLLANGGGVAAAAEGAG